MGVDIVKKGERIPYLSNVTSVSDIVADVSSHIPVETESFDTVVASHVLEHCVDISRTLHEWVRILKPGGSMMIESLLCSM